MTKREKVMALIAAEVANEGFVTKHAMRLYVENRLSAKSFQEAVDHGQKMAECAKQRFQKEKEQLV